jgi:hypothetical protein
MDETRKWAELSSWSDGSARYVLPTACSECDLEFHLWQDIDGEETVDGGMYVVFPVHRGRWWHRVREAWNYIRTGDWPSEVLFERQDVNNLLSVVEHIHAEIYPEMHK